MGELIKVFEQNTFEGAFGVLCVAAIVIVAVVGWQWRSRSKNQEEQQFLAPNTNAGDLANAGSNSEAPAASEEAADGDGDGEGEEGDDNDVFDILCSNDEQLEFLDTEVGALMFFFTNGHDVCDAQWDAFNKLSLVRQEIRFLSVDATDPQTAPIAALHEVHHVPSFVFRRKGDISYRTLIGLLDEKQIADFIDFAMQNPAVIQNAS